jgi:hypothetical protein
VIPQSFFEGNLGFRKVYFGHYGFRNHKKVEKHWAKVYTPNGTEKWPDVTAENSIGSITAGRSYPAVTLVPRTFAGLDVLLSPSCTKGC